MYLRIIRDSTGTYGTDNLALAPWQNFGYTLKWQDEYAESEEAQPRADAINNSNAALAEMDRWENTGLLYTLPAEIQPNLNEFVSAQEYKFATGERKLRRVGYLCKRVAGSGRKREYQSRCRAAWLRASGRNRVNRDNRIVQLIG